MLVLVHLRAHVPSCYFLFPRDLFSQSNPVALPPAHQLHVHWLAIRQRHWHSQASVCSQADVYSSTQEPGLCASQDLIIYCDCLRRRAAKASLERKGSHGKWSQLRTIDPRELLPFIPLNVDGEFTLLQWHIHAQYVKGYYQCGNLEGFSDWISDVILYFPDYQENIWLSNPRTCNTFGGCSNETLKERNTSIFRL